MTEQTRIPIPQGLRPAVVNVPVSAGTYTVYLDWSADAPHISNALFRALRGDSSSEAPPAQFALTWTRVPAPYCQGQGERGLWIHYARP